MAREKKISQNPAIAKDELLVKLGFREMIDITKLLYNEGQIDGVPKNPRYLKESEYDKLVKSLTDSPEFLGVQAFDGLRLGEWHIRHHLR